MTTHEQTTRPPRRRPSLALVVALLALVASLGGTAYAAQVAPKNSVVSKSIKKGAVKAPDMAQIVAEYAYSPQTADADGTTNGGDHGVASAEVQCPAGTKVISGGAHWVDSDAPAGDEVENVYVQMSQRVDNGWSARGIVDYGAQGTIRLGVVAYCLVGPGFQK